MYPRRTGTVALPKLQVSKGAALLFEAFALLPYHAATGNLACAADTHETSAIRRVFSPGYFPDYSNFNFPVSIFVLTL